MTSPRNLDRDRLGLRLGRLALDRGWITSDELRRALEIQRPESATDLDALPPLGSVLVAMGFLTEDRRAALLDLQAGRLDDLRTLRRDDEWLGEILVRTGRITRGRLHESLRRQARCVEEGDTRVPRLGELLVMSGFVSGDAVREALSAQRRVLLGCPPCGKVYSHWRYDPARAYRCKDCRAPLKIVTEAAAAELDLGGLHESVDIPPVDAGREPAAGPPPPVPPSLSRPDTRSRLPPARDPEDTGTGLVPLDRGAARGSVRPYAGVALAAAVALAAVAAVRGGKESEPRGPEPPGRSSGTVVRTPAPDPAAASASIDPAADPEPAGSVFAYAAAPPEQWPALLEAAEARAGRSDSAAERARLRDAARGIERLADAETARRYAAASEEADRLSDAGRFEEAFSVWSAFRPVLDRSGGWELRAQERRSLLRRKLAWRSVYERMETALAAEQWKDAQALLREARTIHLPEAQSVLPAWERLMARGLLHEAHTLPPLSSDSAGLVAAPAPGQVLEPAPPVSAVSAPPAPSANEDRPQAQIIHPGTSASFFGLTVSRKNVVYVVDLSDSMDASWSGNISRRQAVLDELLGSLGSLGGDQQVLLVFFGNRAWAADPFAPVSTGDAIRRVRDLRAETWDPEVGGGTDIHHALELALRKTSGRTRGDVEIFLLSDGAGALPTDELRRKIKNLNRGNLAIHTIAFGQDDPTGAMVGLATDTGGSFALCDGPDWKKKKGAVRAFPFRQDPSEAARAAYDRIRAEAERTEGIHAFRALKEMRTFIASDGLPPEIAREASAWMDAEGLPRARKAFDALKAQVEKAGPAEIGDAMNRVRDVIHDDGTPPDIAAAGSKWFMSWLDDQSGQAKALLKKGREAEKAGRWLDAAETYRAVAERHPAAPEAEEARSLASGIEGSAPYREAREDADREHLAQNKLGLARNYLHNRQHAKARELLSEILRDYPKTGAAKEARGLLERL